jgi:predicted O-methyltransferase YrrM
MLWKLALLSESHLMGADRVFEFGSGFGFSAYFFAQAVGASGEVHGSEIEPWAIEMHRTLFSDSALASRIQIHQGDAFDVFASLEGLFDVVFLDLEKVDYARALAVAMPRLRSGGLVMADNVLWGGKTARAPQNGDACTAALQSFNRLIHQRDDLESVILPVGDGLSVSRKIG